MNLAQLQSLVCIAPLESDVSIFTMVRLAIEDRVKSVLGHQLDVHVHRKMSLDDCDTDLYQTSVVLIALMSEVLLNFDDPFSQIEAKFKEPLIQIEPEARSRIYFLTIFPHINEHAKHQHPQLAQNMAKRIRRLNFMIFNLSRQLGVGVIDLDLMLSKLGANLIESDFQVNGRFAPAIAADMIASTVVQEALLEYDADVKSSQACKIATDPKFVLRRALSLLNTANPQQVRHHFLSSL
jgi:hypothetical protein